jgi:hypothetical protein
VQRIGHDLWRQTSLAVEKSPVQIQKKDLVLVGKGWQVVIHGFVDAAEGVFVC